MLGFGVFLIVFVGGMLVLNWLMFGLILIVFLEFVFKFVLMVGSIFLCFEFCGIMCCICVVDGDIFWFEGVKIRIVDIDIFEISEFKCDVEY